jgi:uncharacterized membrane protein
VLNLARHCLLLVIVVCGVPTFAEAEFIDRFQSNIDVRADASFTVTETIDYVFTEERHGIFREIPLLIPRDPNPPWVEGYIDIRFIDAKLDGEDVPYVLESTKDRFVVKIGDPNVTIDGKHTYVLTYDVEGALAYPEGEGTEFYWNVTGNEWPVPIRVVEATLSDPDGIFRSARSCYRGTFGSTDGSCLVLSVATGSIGFRTTELGAGEGMTIAQSLDPTRTARDIRERMRPLILLIPLIFLGLLYGGYRLYRYKTAHKTDATIIPEYEPYPGMKPMYTGLLMDGRLDPRDITACIVYLAEQGYLKIKKTERKAFFLFEVDDYEVELLRLPDADISSFESRIFGLIFKEPLVLGAKVSLGDLKRDHTEQKENYKEFMSLQSDLRNDLVQAGFRERMTWRDMVRPIGIALIVWAVLYVLIAGEVNGGLFIIGAILALVISLMLYERKTVEAYETIGYLEGFKLFLETTERDRYLFHNAPEKSPEQFMEFLPYAIAFGVEEKWAKVFEGITIPNPGWYDGGSVGAFSATNLTSSLGAFSTAFASSSGASASSGGGSSGGGAGGGGGGSW